MEPRKAFLASSIWLVLIIFLTISFYGVKAESSEEHHVTPHAGPVVEKGQRRTLIDTEYGEISSIDIKGGHRAPPYHLQFFTLEPNSVFLPVLLHANMVFYVHTGSGRLTWADEDGTSKIDLREGDLCKLNEGSIFYVHSNLEAERKKLRIYAMFANTDDTTYDPSIGAYSRINELVKGFDRKIIQAAFQVPEDLIEAIINKTDTPAIVHANSKEHKTFWELEASVLKNFLGIRSNAKKIKTYNIFENDPDFKNCHGWSLTVTKKQLKSLKGTNTGFLMVNLTTGSMLGPHWNPRATEIAVVVQGEGMVRVVCGTNNKDKMEDCTNMRFKVKQGDLFVVPKFHPMAQMSFNNDSLVFLGFSTAAKENHPQFLAGKRSVLGVLDRHIMATSFGVSNTTIDQLLASQDDSVIFGCVSCAEEEERIMMEEREEEEEERKREEEEARKREEEERKREEEEEARRQQEERERKREEEEARRQKEAQKEQEEARRQEERRREEEARREQEQARKQQEERERKKEEEAKREQEKERREEEEEQEQKREQEKARRQKEAEREEEQAKRQQEERERRRQEEEAKREQERRQEEEAEREQEQKEAQREEEQEHEKEQEHKEAQREEEQARRQQEERERRRQEEEAKREQEEEAKRRQEEEAKREQERRQEEEAEREQEQARRGEEEAAQREQEQARRQQEERERRREEEEARREQERGREERERQGGRRQHRRGDEGRSQEEEEAEWEQEEARRQQEERERKREQEGDEVEVKGNRSSFEGRRVLKIKKV